MLLTGLRMILAVCLASAAGWGDLSRQEELPESQLDRVSAHVEAGDWAKAKAVLEEFATDEALRSSNTWRSLRSNLGGATTRGDEDPVQKQYRAEVAAMLGLYELALEFCADRIQLLQSDQDIHQARMDAAAIARAAALDAVQSRDYLAAQRYYEAVAKYGYSWVKDLGTKNARLVAEFAKDPESVEARIRFAKTFWAGQARGEARHYADAIALLEETLALPSPISDDQRKDIYVTIRKFCVGDRERVRSWGDKILAEFQDDTDLVARIYVDRAEGAYAEKDIESALRNYRHVCENLPESASYGIAQFNIGMILKTQERYPEAIAEFRKLLTSRVNDQDPTGNIMVAYRNYRPRAQWEIGHCYRAMGKYREALKAYVDTKEKYPFQSWCGNAHAEFSYRYALYQGLCHEHLGEHYEAAIHYWKEVGFGSGLYHNPTIHLRLLDLYEATGQVEALLEILDDTDDRLRARVAKQLGRPLDDEMRETIRPSATIREAMRIRELGTRHQWPDLIALCGAKGTTAGPEEDYARRGNWQAVEAVNALAKAPAETVPLLIDAAAQTERPDINWLYFALGSCGTDAALDFLVKRADVEENTWPLRTIVFSLSIAGERGHQRLEQLSPTAESNLASAIRGWREGWLGGESEAAFPPLPTNARLPQQLAAIDNELRE